MPRVFEERRDASGLRFGVVASRFNEEVTRELLDGAVSALEEHGADGANIDVAWCPGAFEIPLVAQRMAASGDYDAIVTVGAVIRGETTHYELVSEGVANGLMRASLDTGVPILFGVLTVETLEQAFERAGGKMDNKGAEAAVGAIEMVRLLERIGPASD